MVRERLNYQAADGEDSAYTTVMSVMVVLGGKDARTGRNARSKAWASLVVRAPHQPTEEAQ